MPWNAKFFQIQTKSGFLGEKLGFLDTKAKRNHSDSSVEVKDVEQIKGPERYLNLDWVYDWHF